MALQILIFGQLTDITKSSNIAVPEVADTNALRVALLEKYPELARVKFALAVDKQVVTENTPLHSGVAVALLPPFSGG